MTDKLIQTDRATPRYDPERGVYRLEWTQDAGVDLSTLVVSAVSQVASIDHTELTPLHEVVDPDALNRLFEPKPDGTPRTTGGELRFPLSGYEITVRSSGEVLIEPPDGERPPTPDTA